MMKLTLLLLTIVVGLCFAQQSLIQSLPACSMQCMSELSPQVSCNASDIDCLCADKNFVSGFSACVEANCTVRDVLATTNVSSLACHHPVRNDSRTIATLAPTMAAFAFAFIVIRLVARWSMLGWDDASIILGFATSLVVSILNTLMSFHGLGKDIWTVPIDDISHMLFLFYISDPIYAASVNLTKIGMCLFFLRIFPFKRFRIAMWILIGVNAVVLVAFTFVGTLQCIPIRYSWLFYLKEIQGTCLNRSAGVWANASINIALDLIMLALPLIQLWSLKTSYSIRKKIQVMIMFSIGIIVTICSILRLRSLVVFMKSHNPTYDNLACAEWSVVEMNVGVICACLPAARIFFGRIVPKLLGVTSQDSHHAPPSAYVNPGVGSRARPTSWNRITSVGSANGETGLGAIKHTRDFVRLEEMGSEQGSLAPMTKSQQFGP